MPMFRAAEELEKRYAVVTARLLAYAVRGNLAMRRVGGQLLFDELAVARIFPERRASRPSLGVLGTHRLGQPPSAAE
jgi:hypothetical protein